MLWSCSHVFKILRNKNPHIAFDAPHPSLSSFDLWFPISCEGRAPCLRFLEGEDEMFSCILIFRRGSNWKPFERKTQLLHLPESQWSDNILYAFRIRQWPKLAKKIRTEIETPFYPKRQPFNIIRLFCSNWVAMFSSDCRLWTKLKESKYEIANSVTICWNRVFSKFRFFCLF